MLLRTLTISLAAAALAACASSSAPVGYAGDASDTAGRQCFRASQANGFAAQGDRIVNVRVSSREIYQFEMMGPCPDVDWAHRIALRARGGSMICTGIDADIITPTPIGPQRCPVRAVRRLSADEIAALPSGSRP